MSKSKGNVVTPADILEKHGSDAVRYWAATSRLGTDSAFDPQNPTQIKIGRRLAIKVLNAAKFILGFPDTEGAQVTAAVDVSMLRTLDTVIAEATAALENYDHARALEVTETFFWTFCDDYLELVKERAYGGDGGSTGSGDAAAAAAQQSAVAALRQALSTLLRLFAPALPFATAEAWSWFNTGSVHVAPWPEIDAAASAVVGKSIPEADVLALAGAALTGIRRAKTDAKVSQKTPVVSATLTGDEAQLAGLRLVADDLKAVGRISTLSFAAGDSLAVTDIVLERTEL
ncbi:MAG: class I tRNA ligase family protein, partial [Microbacteriaceae bacterium]